MVKKNDGHTHKYMRIKLGKKDFVVMKCMLPGCSHYVRQELATNMMCVCWRCEKSFRMNQQSVLLKKPHCNECKRPYTFKQEEDNAA